MNQEREDESIAGLVSQLIADGRAYASAEAAVYKEKALGWVPAIRSAAILLVAAIFLLQAALTTLLIFVGLWLAFWFGPLGGGIAAVIIALVVAAILAKTALSRLRLGTRA